jgi:hypothetical protein
VNQAKRTDWNKVGRVLRRIGAILSALAVGGVAARATWEHIAHVGRKYGESMADWLPVSVDGMMLVGVIMAADARAAGRPIGPWARTATWTGGILSIAAQIESGRERGWIAAAIATVFSLTLIVTVEALFWHGKAKAPTAPAVTEARKVEEPPAPEPAPVVTPMAPVFSAPPVMPEPVPRRFGRPGDVSLTSPLTGKPLQLNGKRNALAGVSEEGDE